MIQPNVVSSVASLDPGLARLVDELTAKLQGREPIDFSAVLADHPEYAKDLCELLPALAALGDLSQSAQPGLVLPIAGDGSTAGTLGDYRLIREVGRGGMGIVYEAEQISLDRRVALKVLPFAATMDPKQLQRFHNEAKAAASLRHEHIVHVYGVGCERGVHYFAMEFVEGQTLAGVIDDFRLPISDSKAEPEATGPWTSIENRQSKIENAPTSPIAALSTERTGRGREFFRRAAELIADAADALEHAHSLGIVHRDVKPGNLLLDNAGKVYVSDFGLARVGPDAGLTMSGDLLGTLRYMAPEQALARHGLADHRVDVYGLGAALYELLTGKPAVGGTNKADVIRRIAFEEPIAPRKLDKHVPAELETIALKCLAKNPNERYATAGELAADLRRWLENKTIKARPPSLFQRFDRWARRHFRALLPVGAVLVVATAISTWLAVQAWAAQRQAVRDRDRAESAERQALAISNFLQRDVLQQVSRDVQIEDGFKAKTDLTVREALDRAAAKINERFGDQPLVEAALHRTIGNAYRNGVGEHRQVVMHLKQAIELYETQLGADAYETLLCQRDLAHSYQFTGQLPDAIALLEYVFDRQRATVGPDHISTLATLNSLGEACRKAGQYDRALRLIEQALDRKMATLGPDNLDTVNSIHDLGLVLRDLGRYPEAIDRLKTAAAKLEAVYGPDFGDARYCRMNLVEVYEKARQFDQASQLLQNIINRLENGDYRRPMLAAELRIRLGNDLLKQKDAVEAEHVLRDCLSFFEKMVPSHMGRFEAMSLLGEALIEQEQFAAAEPPLLAAYEGMKHLKPVRAAAMLRRIIRCYEKTGQSEKAANWRKLLSPDQPANSSP